MRQISLRTAMIASAAAATGLSSLACAAGALRASTAGDMAVEVRLTQPKERRP